MVSRESGRRQRTSKAEATGSRAVFVDSMFATRSSSVTWGKESLYVSRCCIT